MDGISDAYRVRRTQMLDTIFSRASAIISDKFSQEYKDAQAGSNKLADDLTCLSLAHLSNYIQNVLPEIRPLMTKLVAAIIDVEIIMEDSRRGVSSEQDESGVAKQIRPNIEIVKS